MFRLLAIVLLAAAGACSEKAPAAPSPSGTNMAGTWDVTFSGVIVQRNDGGPIGGSQNDSFVFVFEPVVGGTVSGQWVTNEGRANETRVPLTGTLSGFSLAYRVETAFGSCAVLITADVTVNAEGAAFTGRQTQATCEGRADGQVSARKR